MPTQSALPSPPIKKQLPAKLSPSAHKSSKFSDSEPGPSSPLQIFPRRAASLGSIESQKVSKPSKLNTGSQSGGNRINNRSISSLPEPKKDNNSATPDAKVSMARIRRLSEPKIGSSQRHSSSAKPRSAESMSKSKASNRSESKKISAIVSHDKDKAASLPELKIRKTKEPEVTPSKSTAIDSTQKASGVKSSIASVGPGQKEKNVPHHNDVDDNPVVEKTVVLLEEKPSVSTAHHREKSMEVQKGVSDSMNTKQKNEVSDYVAIRAPVSPVGVDKKPIEHQTQKEPTVYEVGKTDSFLG